MSHTYSIEVKAGLVIEPLLAGRVPAGWQELPKTIYTQQRFFHSLPAEGLAVDGPAIVVQREMLASVLPILIGLGPAWGPGAGITLAIAIDYPEPGFTIELEAPVVTSLGALGFGLDVDCYAIVGPTRDEFAFTPARHRLGLSIGRPPDVDLRSDRVITTDDGWMSARTRRGGLVGNHIAHFLQPFIQWRGVILASAVLGTCTLWCESTGGWGRPGIVLTSRQVRATTAVGAGLKFRVEVR